MNETIRPRRAVSFDVFARACVYFTSDTEVNSGYGCTYPGRDGEPDEDSCYCRYCPLGSEAKEDDWNDQAIEWYDECSDGEVVESEFIVVRCDEKASNEELMALYYYDRYMHRYDKEWLRGHPRPVLKETSEEISYREGGDDVCET